MYSRAKSGMNKVFTGEILSLVTAVLHNIGQASFAVGLVASVLAIVSYVIILVGLKEASADNVTFGNAMTFSIISLVLSIIGSVTSIIPIVGAVIPWLIKFVIIVLDFCMIKCIVTGCAELNSYFITSAGKIVKAAMIAMILDLINNALFFLGGLLALSALISLIATFYCYIMMLILIKSFSER